MKKIIETLTFLLFLLGVGLLFFNLGKNSIESINTPILIRDPLDMFRPISYSSFASIVLALVAAFTIRDKLIKKRILKYSILATAPIMAVSIYWIVFHIQISGIGTEITMDHMPTAVIPAIYLIYISISLYLHRLSKKQNLQVQSTTSSGAALRD